MMKQCGYSARFVLIAIVFGILAMSGCDSDAVTVVDDKRLDRNLSSIIQGGGSVHLNAFIAGDWDEIRIYAKDAWSREGLQREIGQDLDMPDYYMEKGSIILMVRDGRVVHGISIDTYLTPGAYRGGVVVRLDENTKELQVGEQ
ncbi:MAG: hypothetical protein GEU86_18470 [Actinophytocola sp.]|nr:hypothetical protein [Actinophytocola sp.]